MTNKKILISPYHPREIFKSLHTSMDRFFVIAAHRRAGKTMFCVNHLIIKALQNSLKNPVYIYLAPERDQVKKIAWGYIKEFVRWIPGHKISESELKVEFPIPNGSTAIIYADGAADPHKLRGIYLDGAVLDEVAQMPPDTWNEVIRPSLADRKGWAIMIGTPKGRNFFYDKYMEAVNKSTKDGIELKDWGGLALKASETGFVDAEELESMKASMGVEKFMQEMEIDWTASFEGSYYGKYMQSARLENRINNNYVYDPRFPVYTAWDLGGADSTCIWFAQYINGELRLIDFYKKKGELDLRHFINVVMGKPYVYKRHFLPHDVEQKHMNSVGATRLEAFRAAGMPFDIIKKTSRLDGIQVVRSVLPFTTFNRSKCEYGIQSLEMYECKVDDVKGADENSPIHNWASHAADAFRYLCHGIRPQKNLENSNVSRLIQKTSTNYESFNPFDI